MCIWYAPLAPIIKSKFLTLYSKPDVTQKRSFDEVSEFYEDIRLAKDMPPSVPFVMVANKCDEPKRRVSTEEGQALADQLNCKYIEASAKTNTNVSEAFAMIAEDILDHLEKSNRQEENRRENSGLKERKKKKCSLF